MRAGELRHRVIVQKPTETQDGMGEPDVAWSEFDTLWAGETAVSGSEREGRNTALTARPASWLIRWRGGISEKLRLLVPRESTDLDGAINASVDTITVTSADDFPLEGDFRIKVESEIMLVTAGHSTTSWTVTRAQDGTTGATHADTKLVERMEVVDIESVVDPNGRRERLQLEGVVRG